jgi:hypothetical protein
VYVFVYIKWNIYNMSHKMKLRTNELSRAGWNIPNKILRRMNTRD